MVQIVNNKKTRKKLNLKNDIVFKAFFSRKGNEEFLIDFLEHHFLRFFQLKALRWSRLLFLILSAIMQSYQISG